MHCDLLASVWPNKYPIVKYLLNWDWCVWSAEGSLKQWLPNGKLLCCLSQNAMVCLAHCRRELQQKSWKTARLFRQKTKCSRPKFHDPRPRPRLSFLSSRRLKTKTLVSRTTWLNPRALLVAVERFHSWNDNQERSMTGAYLRGFTVSPSPNAHLKNFQHYFSISLQLQLSILLTY